MPSTPVITSKAAVRRLMVQRRAELDERFRETASLAVRDVLLRTLEHATIRCVAGFWPLAGEIDPRPAMAAFRRLGAEQALPRMQSFTRPLVFHRHAAGSPLIEGRFKVMEPAADAPTADPDLILVPLLAFDRAGRRLGYGAGFYDRTIGEQRRRGPVTAIGVAFACQEADKVPVEPHDQPLDGVATEREFIPTAPPALRPA